MAAESGGKCPPLNSQPLRPIDSAGADRAPFGTWATHTRPSRRTTQSRRLSCRRSFSIRHSRQLTSLLAAHHPAAQTNLRTPMAWAATRSAAKHYRPPPMATRVHLHGSTKRHPDTTPTPHLHLRMHGLIGFGTRRSAPRPLLPSPGTAATASPSQSTPTSLLSEPHSTRRPLIPSPPRNPPRLKHRLQFSGHVPLPAPLCYVTGQIEH